MTIDQFDAPATGGKITDFDGALLLITPTELREAIQTVHGPSDAIVCDLAVLDGNDAGTQQSGVMVFPKVLQGQLKAKVGTGRMVLGRLGRGQAKPGQSAPWVLGDPTEQDKNLARQHLDKVAPPF